MTQPGEPQAPTAAIPAPVRRGPRPPWARNLLTIAIWLGVWPAPMMLVDTLWPPTGAPLVDAGPFHVEDAAELSFVLVLAVYALLARWVSYRWFDALFLLVPLYNLMWSVRIARRVALLPYRDWEPRSDEVDSWVAVERWSSTYPWPLYVRRPRS